MKQTAVEQLVQEINKLTGLNILMDEPCVIQAKEIEKEQIINAHEEGFYSPPFRMSRRREADEYYNETFKSE
jgi:hypothetical protein